MFFIVIFSMLYLCFLTFAAVAYYFHILLLCLCDETKCENLLGNEPDFDLFLYSHYTEDGVLQLDGMETLPPSRHRRVNIQT